MEPDQWVSGTRNSCGCGLVDTADLGFKKTGDLRSSFRRGRETRAEHGSLSANKFDSTGSEDGLQDVP